MVKRAEGYAYSSAGTHVRGGEDAILGEDLFPHDRRKDYILLLRSAMPEKESENLRYAIRTGRPFGSREFVVEMENELERRLSQRARGRPGKESKL